MITTLMDVLIFHISQKRIPELGTFWTSRKHLLSGMDISFLSEHIIYIYKLDVKMVERYTTE